jgi:hypothetical protein
LPELDTDFGTTERGQVLFLAILIIETQEIRLDPVLFMIESFSESLYGYSINEFMNRRNLYET